MIDIAKEMIAGTEKTVSQIVYELGFQYSQHFNRIFKKNTGYTPVSYTHLDVYKRQPIPQPLCEISYPNGVTVRLNSPL